MSGEQLDMVADLPSLCYRFFERDATCSWWSFPISESWQSRSQLRGLKVQILSQLTVRFRIFCW